MYTFQMYKYLNIQNNTRIRAENLAESLRNHNGSHIENMYQLQTQCKSSLQRTERSTRRYAKF